MVDYPGRLAPLWPRFPAWDRWINRQHALGLKRAISNYGDCDELIVFLFHPMFQPWLEWLKPKHVVYHVFDAHNMMKNWDSDLGSYEQAIIETCRSCHHLVGGYAG